jgi:hypothetical protein
MAKIASANITFKISWAVADNAPDSELSDVLDEVSIGAIEAAIQEAVGPTVIVELDLD